LAESFDWNALQSFLAVARAGRLTLAARRLGIDHSTLSRRLKDLETALETRLFERSVQGYVLTPQGERLLESAQAMETVAFSILKDVAGASLRIAGTVRIGAPDGLGASFLAPRLGRLGELHPELSIQLVTMPRIFSLTKREADIAIGLAPPNEGRLHARKLTDYELGLFASADYLERMGTPQDRGQLRRHRLIGYVSELIYTPELDYVPLIDKELEPSLTSSNLTAQLRMTASGHGICVLPCFMAAGDPRLLRVMGEDFSLIRSFWLIIHSDIRDLARVRVTSEFIAQEIRANRRLFLPRGMPTAEPSEAD
jgi:DNA-binding transcriptional LysR family regulator